MISTQVQYVISCDWGTSSFRLRLVAAGTKSVLAESTSDQGIAATYALWQQASQPDRLAFYCDILQQHIRVLESICGYALTNTMILVSGMASAQIGLKELPYQIIPLNILQAGLATHFIPGNHFFQYNILLVSGLRSGNDVMRGEETILAGCEIKSMASEQLFVLPGTHSKHVVVKEGKLTGFQTFMTGEIFALLAKKSILANSVEPGSDNVVDNAAFLKGVQDAATSNLLQALFHVRTNQLFDVYNKYENYEYLSGLLIGTEFKNVVPDQYAAITIVSEGKLGAYYKSALSIFYDPNKITSLNAADALISGHIALFLQSTKNYNK